MARYTKEQLQWARERVPETVPRREWNRKAYKLLDALPLLAEWTSEGYDDMRIVIPPDGSRGQFQLHHAPTDSWVPTKLTGHSKAFLRLTHSLQRGELTRVVGAQVTCKHKVTHRVNLQHMGNAERSETSRVLPGTKCHACNDEAFPQRAQYRENAYGDDTRPDTLYTFTHDGVTYYGRTFNLQNRVFGVGNRQGYKQQLGYAPDVQVLLEAPHGQIRRIEALMTDRVLALGGKRHDLVKRTEYVPEGLTVGRLLILAIGDYERERTSP